MSAPDRRYDGLLRVLDGPTLHALACLADELRRPRIVDPKQAAEELAAMPFGEMPGLGWWRRHLGVTPPTTSPEPGSPGPERAQEKGRCAMSTLSDTSTAALGVEMVPGPLWGSNLRRLAPEAWRIVRSRARSEAAACAFCGGVPEHCHEVWEYVEHDDCEGTARLARVAMICEHCHEVVHLGRTGNVHGAAGVDQAKAHLAAVNGWSSAEVEAHVAAARATWERRSAMRWGLDFGPVVEDYGLGPDDLRGCPVAMVAAAREELAG